MSTRKSSTSLTIMKIQIKNIEIPLSELLKTCFIDKNLLLAGCR